MFMTAGDDRLGAQKPGRFTYAWIGLMGLAILTGLGLVGIWGLAWRICRDYGILSRPAAVAAVGLLAWPMRKAVVSAGGVLGIRGRTNQTSLAVALAVVVGVGFVSLVDREPKSYEYAMPYWLACIRPERSIFRVLLLMPVWGAWSMLIAIQFCRPDGATDSVTRRFARGCGPLAAAACLAPPLAGTIVYFHYLGPAAQAGISAVTVATAIASGPILCRLARGLTRDALLTGNLLTQLAFLMACLGWQ